MTPSDIRALLERASPTPWVLDNTDPNEPLVIRDSKGVCLMQFSFSLADCELAAKAPTLIAQLLSQLDLAREALGHIQAVTENYADASVPFRMVIQECHYEARSTLSKLKEME